VIHQCNGPKSLLVTLQFVVESKVQQLPQAKHKGFQLDTKLSLMYEVLANLVSVSEF
jgi:hypothetical protein